MTTKKPIPDAPVKATEKNRLDIVPMVIFANLNIPSLLFYHLLDNFDNIKLDYKFNQEVYMKGFSGNIEKLSIEGNDFRKVLYTAKNSQLVIMSLKPKEDIGEEVHDDGDQFIRVDKGVGKAMIDGNEYDLEDGSAIVVPMGARHNVTNTSETEPMKLYTIYSPAHHLEGTVHATKEDAMRDEEEHFDGTTTE